RRRPEPLPGKRDTQRRRNGVDIETGSEWWSLEQQPVAYYRAAAARARRLQAEATTPRLKQYLGEVIARCERVKPALVDRQNPVLATGPVCRRRVPRRSRKNAGGPRV